MITRIAVCLPKRQATPPNVVLANEIQPDVRVNVLKKIKRCAAAVAV